MKIAIFHDYFRFIGGGEKLALTLARGLGADVITTDVDRALIKKMGFDDVNILSLGPLVKTEPLRQIQATLRFSACDFRGRYDFFVFSGNWAHHASRRHRPNLYYNHAHVRVFYDLKEQTVRSLGNPLSRLAARAWIAGHTALDKRSIRRVDRVVSNSEFTARRFKKYLGRDSVVVYPPVDTAKFHGTGDDGYWLSVNRLFPEKRIELQLEAFARMPAERLIIIGGSDIGDYSGAYARRIREKLPPNVELLGGLSEGELIEHYARCRGLVATSRDEPFGMNAVEAMASGKPVVAVGEGGYVESVLDGRTGKLVEPTPEALIGAVKEISKGPLKYRDACIARAKEFDITVFLNAMNSLIRAGV
ncbi:MAG TPA: glycosyltransferase [Methanocella sp.]|nr:glycosyltransferase [Methanocella sp.]